MFVLATVHGAGEAAEKLGVIAVALLASVFVLGRPRWLGAQARSWRSAAVLGALVLTPVLLVVAVWDTSPLVHLRHHRAEAGAAIVVGLAIVAALVAAFRRRPAWLAFAAVACVPFRLPISTGGTTSNLLVPLYLVVGAGALAYVLEGRDPDSDVDEAGPGRLEWLLLASVVLYAVQDAYSGNFTKGLENVVFFYVPFALLFALLRRLRWPRELLLVCAGIAAVEAVLFSGVGFVEYATKHLLLNPSVVQANDYDNYFRVNSLFFDPSIYGRFLAIVMIVVMTAVLWSRSPRIVAAGGLILLWLLGGLVTSFSQSSIAALLLGLAVLAAYRWNVRDTVLVCVALLALGAVVVLLAPAHSHLGLGSGSTGADNATSGRYSLIKNGLDLFAHRPIEGYGSGSFSTEYSAHHLTASADSVASASHTIPITVAAEQGLIGLALYVALLIAAFGRLFAGAQRSPARIAVAAAFAALVLHTFTYADFLEDPITWTLLAVGASLALAQRARPAARVGTAAPQPADVLDAAPA